MKWDGHTHTNFCPHGTKDKIEEYIEQAIRLGFTDYSITEHAPLPENFDDPTPMQDSAMCLDDLDAYLEECRRVKEKYKELINIRIGLEIDYLMGLEEETKRFINEVGPELDDAILSVHFLPVGERWSCLDYSPEEFEVLIEHLGSVDEVYAHYFEVLGQAVEADLGVYKPKRIGHFTLVEKFKIKYPSANQQIWWNKAIAVLKKIKAKGYQLDFNTAGMQKPLCRDVYPSTALFNIAKQMGIPFVYGSDAHRAKDVGHHYHLFAERVT